MPRPPMPLGTWGEIRTSGVGPEDKKGTHKKYRAFVNYRDYDGRTRQLERTGRSKADATNRLKIMLKERTEVGQGGLLTAQHRFKDAVDIWIQRFEAAVKEERRSPGNQEVWKPINVN
ncbi:MAG: hypothetical protein ACRDQZ_04560 [Mycobacteriales bacterium]